MYLLILNADEMKKSFNMAVQLGGEGIVRFEIINYAFSDLLYLVIE